MLKTENTPNAVTVAYRIIEGECIALFPNMKCDSEGNITSYMHIGQHAAASPELLYNRKATPNEYKELHKELVNMVGYKINMII